MGFESASLPSTAGYLFPDLRSNRPQSELDNMQAVCAKVSTVSEFLDEAAERVSTLEAGLEKEERERRERGRETGEAFRCLRADLAKKSDA